MSRLFVFTGIMLLSFSAAVFAQSGDVSINIVVFNSERLQTLILADLDLEQVGSAEELFEIQVINNTGKAFSRCHLLLQVLKDDELLLQSNSKEFEIPEAPPGTIYSANNIQLINNQFKIGDSYVKMEQGEIEKDVENIHKEILASGKVPMGVYKISAILFNDAENVELDRREVTFLQATNPSYVQNVAPGQPFGSAVEGAVFTEFPVFQWSGNGDDYQVLVFEKKEMLETLDDILNSRPNWESDRTSTFSLQYPQEKAVPLEFGKSYYWLVRMFVRTSSGEQVVNSDVWTFALKDPSKRGDDQARISKDEILSFLKDFFGTRGEALEAQLEGYQLSGIRFNGEKIDKQTLYRLLSKYRGESHEIYDLYIGD